MTSLSTAARDLVLRTNINFAISSTNSLLQDQSKFINSEDVISQRIIYALSDEKSVREIHFLNSSSINNSFASFVSIHLCAIKIIGSLVTDDTLMALAENCPKLEYISLVDCSSHPKFQGINWFLQKCKSLKYFDLAYHSVNWQSRLDLKRIHPNGEFINVPSLDEYLQKQDDDDTVWV